MVQLLKVLIEMNAMEECKDLDKEEQDIIQCIFDKSKEMNIQGISGTVGNELELIALVRNCDFLYNKNLCDFRDVRKKNVAWGAIASVLHCKVHEVQQRWRSLREGYNKYKKDIELADDENDIIRPWEFYEEMKFIDPFLVRRSSMKLNKCLNENSSTELETNLSSDATDNKNTDRNLDMMKFIRCIKTRPVLYDSKHPHYKNKEAKIHAWNEVAQVMNTSVTECEIKWKNLRERYGRERKMKYVQNDRRRWEYFDVLDFLDVHIRQRKHSIFRPILPKVDDNKNNASAINSSVTPVGNHQTVILKQLVKRATPIEDVEIKNNSSINYDTHYDVQHIEFVDVPGASGSHGVTPPPNGQKLHFKNSFVNAAEQNHIIVHDEDELFGQTISAELRRIPSGKKKMRIKAEIYKLLYENESDD